MNWKKVKKELRILKEKKVTEEEITKEHGQILTFIGGKIYQTLVPALEVAEGLYRVLHLNREMYKLKQETKEKAAEDVSKKEPAA